MRGVQRFNSCFISTALLILTAAFVTGCDSYEPCHQHFGDRQLPGEQTPAGSPTRLVSACMYGAEVVGPIIMHTSFAETECQKKYSMDEIRKVHTNITQDVSAVLEEMDACVAGGKGYVRQVLHFDDVPASLNNCEKIRGTYNINPNLPCD